MKVTKHDAGRFCWAELVTTDGSAAKAFYKVLMGWEAQDSPMGPDMVYSMMLLDGTPAGAMYEDNSGKSGPPHWNVYIAVDDVDASAARAAELGGVIIAPPFDVMEVGRMAVVKDPTGAVFSMWQPKLHPGYGVVDEAGAVCWNELTTRDTARAEIFYSGLFGYGVKHSNMSMPYTEFQLEGKSIAGMMAMAPEMAGVPPYWSVYFAVADCDATCAKATSLGATALLPPMEVPTVGKISIMKDPQGAVFAFLGP